MNNDIEKEDESQEEFIPAPEQPKEAPAKEKPSRPEKQRPGFWMRALRWSLGLLVVFGLGVVLVIFALYFPIRREVNAARSDLQSVRQEATQAEASANQQITQLQNKIKDLSSLETKNQELQKELDQANLHVVILSARADVVTAQLALANNDATKARVALSKTPETLTRLQNLLPTDQSKVATDMQARLKLALSEIDSNAYAAQSDLNVLSTGLVDLENTLYSKP